MHDNFYFWKQELKLAPLVKEQVEIQVLIPLEGWMEHWTSSGDPSWKASHLQLVVHHASFFDFGFFSSGLRVRGLEETFLTGLDSLLISGLPFSSSFFTAFEDILPIPGL